MPVWAWGVYIVLRKDVVSVFSCVIENQQSVVHGVLVASFIALMRTSIVAV